MAVEGDHISLSATSGCVREAVTVVAVRLSAVESTPASATELVSGVELSTLLTKCGERERDEACLYMCIKQKNIIISWRIN